MTRNDINAGKELIPLNHKPPLLPSEVKPHTLFENIPSYKSIFEKYQINHANNRLITLNASRERLDKLGESMERIIVSPENMQEVRVKVDEILKWPEGIGGNIVLENGDKFTWNKEAGTMIILSKTGQMKFGIRLIPESKSEYNQNQNLAKDMQSDYEKMHPSQEKSSPSESRENLIDGGKVLGDWLVRRGAWPGKNNSCGASCGELLNQFGFRKILPQSGRDGKNWDTILENYASEYFTKIPVSHPNDAPAGSILVFNEGANGAPKYKKWKINPRWSSGHVEIKGSNGLFYSYYKSVNAGGSVTSNSLRGESYNRHTGFTGYAYVYNGKKPPR